MFFPVKTTVGEAFILIRQALDESGLWFGHGTDNAHDEAGWLLDATLRHAGWTEYTEEDVLPDSLRLEIQSTLERRIRQKVPLAYLLQEAWFAGLSFHVDERVLVPRSPLAELIINDFRCLLPKEPARILDLCCGSGCIGIACAVQVPAAHVDLSDISAGALQVAEINIARHGLGDRVRAVHSDLFSGLQGPYDLIISNPPYVSQQEYAELPEEYHCEPELGLVSADQGLALPGAILQQAGQYLTADGVLLLEVGYSWQALADAWPRVPFLWLEFEAGGEGVALLTQKQLDACFPGRRQSTGEAAD